MPLYFAYGLNMDAAAMALRCPASRLVGRARLSGHRFMIMRAGYASVVPAAGGTVWGVAWDLAPDDVPALDRFEGVAGGLYVKAFRAVATEAGVRRALIYLGGSAAPGLARPGYMEAVIAAGEAAQLPAEHLRTLRGWLRPGRA